MKKILLSCLVTFALGELAMASGYQVLLQGNRQAAMGNVGVGLRPDASSVFFNPGAMGMMRRNSVMVGTNLIFSSNTYYASDLEFSDYTAQTDNPIGTPFHFYSVLAGENTPLTFGLGIYTPYGSSVQWEEGWRGQNLLQSLSLQAIFVQPTLAYRFSDQFSIGAGFIYAFGGVNLQRGLPVSGAEPSTAEFDGSASGLGYNVGVYFEPNQQWSFGLTYRSRVNMDVEGGEARFNVPVAAQPTFQATEFNASLPLPSVTSLGITYYPSERVAISAEANYTGWGAYEALTFEFNAPVNNANSTTSRRNYEDAWAVRLGTEWMAVTNLALRFGLYYDQTPVQDGFMTPETPDSDRIGLTAGLGYQLTEAFKIDASFIFINGFEREQTVQQGEQAGTIRPQEGAQDVLPGTYKLNAFIPGLSLSFNF